MPYQLIFEKLDTNSFLCWTYNLEPFSQNLIKQE